MMPFALARPRTHAEASALMTGRRWSLPILKGGGLDVVDHLKEGLLDPDALVDVKRLRPAGMTDAVEASGTGLRIAGNATLAEIAASDLVRTRMPALAKAAGSAATPQVRNVATAAGNLLQRPRCWYYRGDQFDCAKKGGDLCYAQSGENEFHAIFGNRPCAMVHPSNLAPVLWIAGGSLELTGSDRATLRVDEMFVAPDEDISREHRLAHGEVITAIVVPGVRTSGFYAIKHKKSFDWPLAFAAVGLVLDGTRIEKAMVCAGAVAPVPWPLPAVGEALAGVDVTDAGALDRACAVASRRARPLARNEYKTTLLPVAVKRAVLDAAGRLTEDA